MQIFCAETTNYWVKGPTGEFHPKQRSHGGPTPMMPAAWLKKFQKSKALRTAWGLCRKAIHRLRELVERTHVPDSMLDNGAVTGVLKHYGRNRTWLVTVGAELEHCAHSIASKLFVLKWDVRNLRADCAVVAEFIDEDGHLLVDDPEFDKLHTDEALSCSYDYAGTSTPGVWTYVAIDWLKESLDQLARLEAARTACGLMCRTLLAAAGMPEPPTLQRFPVRIQLTGKKAGRLEVLFLDGKRTEVRPSGCDFLRLARGRETFVCDRRWFERLIEDAPSLASCAAVVVSQTGYNARFEPSAALLNALRVGEGRDSRTVENDD
jgi:hypothetical protein